MPAVPAMPVIPVRRPPYALAFSVLVLGLVGGSAYMLCSDELFSAMPLLLLR